jgi:transposase
MLQEMDSFEGGDGGSPAPWANDAFDLKSELHRVLGVDLTQVPGLEVKTAQVLLSEVGVNLAKSFRSAEAFVSWLGLCPDNRVSGGKVLSARIRKVHNRVANALRAAGAFSAPFRLSVGGQLSPHAGQTRTDLIPRI